MQIKIAKLNNTLTEIGSGIAREKAE